MTQLVVKPKSDNLTVRHQATLVLTCFAAVQSDIPWPSWSYCLPSPPWVCTFILYRRALSGGRCQGWSAITFQLVFITDRQPHPTVYRRRPSLSGLIWLPCPVAAARVWNSLPEHVTSGPSVAVFRSRLKTHLFDISYPDPVWLYSACAVTLVASDTISVLVTNLLTCGVMMYSDYSCSSDIKCPVDWLQTGNRHNYNRMSALLQDVKHFTGCEWCWNSYLLL